MNRFHLYSKDDPYYGFFEELLKKCDDKRYDKILGSDNVELRLIEKDAIIAEIILHGGVHTSVFWAVENRMDEIAREKDIRVERNYNCHCSPFAANYGFDTQTGAMINGTKVSLKEAPLKAESNEDRLINFFDKIFYTQKENEMTAKHFWIITSQIKVRPDEFRYIKESEAIKDAECLARKHIGEKFYVLKTIGCYAVQPNEVSEVEFEEGE